MDVTPAAFTALNAYSVKTEEISGELHTDIKYKPIELQNNGVNNHWKAIKTNKKWKMTEMDYGRWKEANLTDLIEATFRGEDGDVAIVSGTSSSAHLCDSLLAIDFEMFVRVHPRSEEGFARTARKEKCIWERHSILRIYKHITHFLCIYISNY